MINSRESNDEKSLLRKIRIVILVATFCFAMFAGGITARANVGNMKIMEFSGDDFAAGRTGTIEVPLDASNDYYIAYVTGNELINREAQGDSGRMIISGTAKIQGTLVQ